MTPRRKIIIVIALMGVTFAGLTPLWFHPHKPAKRLLPRQTEVVGIGVALRINTRTHELLVNDVVSNTPAAEAGITNGIIISKVDGVPMKGKPINDCANMIRGAAGSTVTLELVTPDHSQTNVMELTRRSLGKWPASPGGTMPVLSR